MKIPLLLIINRFDLLFYYVDTSGQVFTLVELLPGISSRNWMFPSFPAGSRKLQAMLPAFYEGISGI